MPKYEARVRLANGQTEIVTVDAADREDAKYHFLNNPIVIDGEVQEGAFVDRRTVRLSKEQPQKGESDGQ